MPANNQLVKAQLRASERERERDEKSVRGREGLQTEGTVRSIIKAVTDSCFSIAAPAAPAAPGPHPWHLPLDVSTRSLWGPDRASDLSDSFNKANYSGLQGPVMLSADSTHCGARVTVLTVA